MNNKPHSESAKKKISEGLKNYWANITDEQRQARKQKLINFYARLNSIEEEEFAKAWQRQHEEYIKDEYLRLFGTDNI